MPRKIRELISDLRAAGFAEIDDGEGSHRKYPHERYPGAITVSGKAGDDANKYQEKQVAQAIESLKR